MGGGGAQPCFNPVEVQPGPWGLAGKIIIQRLLKNVFIKSNIFSNINRAAKEKL
jgi:hypothetical protein